jgi:hypothetical protein
MKVGDLVEYKNDKRWGIGIIVRFLDSGFPNHYPWIEIYWGKWKRTNQGPISYYRKVTK